MTDVPLFDLPVYLGQTSINRSSLLMTLYSVLTAVLRYARDLNEYRLTDMGRIVGNPHWVPRKESREQAEVRRKQPRPARVASSVSLIDGLCPNLEEV